MFKIIKGAPPPKPRHDWSVLSEMQVGDKINIPAGDVISSGRVQMSKLKRLTGRRFETRVQSDGSFDCWRVE